MQRTRIRLEQEARKKSERKLQKSFIRKKNENKLLEKKKEPTLKFENRYELLEDLSFGRMSFRGFNPEVEKLMKYYKDLKDDKVSDGVDFDDGHDVTDYELATSIFSTKAKREEKYLSSQEISEKNLTDEINEQPTKRKRRRDEYRLESGDQKKQHV
uniref:NUC153 domain-containing protein n=1 Tax=Setaria digitata TaxID=48799 RepID=A0A915PY79_9BILA